MDDEQREQEEEQREEERGAADLLRVIRTAVERKEAEARAVHFLIEEGLRMKEDDEKEDREDGDD